MLTIVDNQLESCLLSMYNPGLLKRQSEHDSCLSCLGILQHCESKVPQVIDQASVYEFTSFKMSLKVPLSCHLRYKYFVSKVDKVLGESLEEGDYVDKVAKWRDGHVDMK